MKIQTMQNQKAKSLIKACAKFSGIKQELEEDDYLFIMQMLKNQFSYWSLSDVTLAFETYAADKLGEIEHYGSFSPKFFGKVLHAFKEYRAKQNRIKPIEPSKQIEMKEEPKEERQLRAYEFIKDCYEKGEEIYTANWSDCFFYLEENGLIKMSIKEKKAYRDKVAEEIKTSLQSSTMPIRKIKELIQIQASPLALQAECRKRIVQEYFENRI